MSIQTITMPGEIVTFSLDGAADQEALAAATRDYDTQMREVREAEVIDENLVDQIRFF